MYMLYIFMYVYLHIYMGCIPDLTKYLSCSGRDFPDSGGPAGFGSCLVWWRCTCVSLWNLCGISLRRPGVLKVTAWQCPCFSGQVRCYLILFCTILLILSSSMLVYIILDDNRECGEASQVFSQGAPVRKGASSYDRRNQCGKKQPSHDSHI